VDVKILNEAGYDEAIYGLSLSHGVSQERAVEVAKKLAPKDGGHNKVLESIMLWINVEAPRYWWQEADTYRLSTKQSASTMHTIHKRLLEQGDFENNIDDAYLVVLNRALTDYRDSGSRHDLAFFKSLLPEGFLQQRVWVMSYKTARNIILQRHNHRMPGWQMFCNTVLETCEHPELLPGPPDWR
jgi:hypothetical protein